MNVERALITTVESERNIIAVRKVVASRESPTICRQITFLRDTGIYVGARARTRTPLSHRHGQVARDAEIVRQVEMPFRAQNTKLHPAMGNPSKDTLPLYSRVIAPVYRNTGKSVLVPFFFSSSFFFLSLLSPSLLFFLLFFYAQTKYFPGLTRFFPPRIEASTWRSCLPACLLDIL